MPLAFRVLLPRPMSDPSEPRPVALSHAAIAVVFALILVVAAIEPTNPGAFWLENAPVAVFVLVLVLSYRRFQFSTAAYLHMLALLLLHELGAHFTYAKNPVGFWLADAFDLSRNHYDRIVHFSFGLLIARPLAELFVHAVKVPSRAARWLAPVGILAMAGGYELLEFWTAETVQPDVGAAFLGAQGDPWDAQQDMMVALLGASLWSAVALRHRRIASTERR
jgi:putative membrane protein